MRRRARLDRFSDLSGALGLLDDRTLHELVRDAPVISEGIGGTAKGLEVRGVPVFVKCIPLTDLERRPENLRSTANLFELPLGCHYGVGSPGLGVWREVAAQVLASSWVLGGRSPSFPLLYHWRVLELPAWAGPLPDELADVDRAVAHWHGSPSVRRRVEAIGTSSSSVVLFLEHLPLGLPAWLEEQLAVDDEAGSAAIDAVARSLVGSVAFMNRSGVLHFDAHVDNLRTDGHQLFLTDFGLATSPSFALTRAEAAFVTANATHDVCHAVTRLVDWLVTALTDVADWQERDRFVVRCGAGHDPVGLLPAARAVISRYAPVAVVINELYRRLHLEDRSTPYPTVEAEWACATAGLLTGR